MIHRLLSSLLVALALLLAPAGMGTAPAAAKPVAVQAAHQGHCGGEAPAEEKRAPIHLSCAGSCAAMPAAEPALASHDDSGRAAPAVPAPSRLSGIAPESETPPPRSLSRKA
jgi:hypothetical protein